MDAQDDAKLAAELREAAKPHLEALCGLMDKAKAHGLILGFNLGQNQYGRSIVNALDVVKPL